MLIDVQKAAPCLLSASFRLSIAASGLRPVRFTRSAQAAEIDLSPWRGRVPTEMLGRSQFPRIGDTPYVITLAPYGFFWFHLREDLEPPVEPAVVVPEFITLVLGAAPGRLLDPWGQRAFERAGYRLEGETNIDEYVAIHFRRDGGRP